MEGDVVLVAIQIPQISVSNPLRLEGDPPFHDYRPSNASFLIHYGWRGTRIPFDRKLRADLVSNPLRLEGDGPKGDPGETGPQVSNPLRLEGDTRSWFPGTTST